MAVTVATPAKLVVADVDESAALGPEAGEEKVTIAPLTGLLPASRTVTCNATGKSRLIGVDCVAPPDAAITAATPVEFVNVKVAGVTTPATDAVTL